MGLEIEAKFLEIDVQKFRKQLRELGARKVHRMVMYRRYVFNLLDRTERGYVRTRDENGRVTITVKRYPAGSKYAEEQEIKLGSDQTLEEARDFLIAQGYVVKTYHETLREKWSLGGCPEIAIDTLPGMPTYVELECSNEREMHKLAKRLGFRMEDAKYGPYVEQYIDRYKIDIDNGKYPSLTFKNVEKELKVDKQYKDLLKEATSQNKRLCEKFKIDV